MSARRVLSSGLRRFAIWHRLSTVECAKTPASMSDAASASLLEKSAPSAAAGGVRAERLLFIDNLRWSAISMVVVLHAAVTYSHVGSWYFYDSAETGRTATIWLVTYQTFQHAVAMGLLFGIAGYFAQGAIERKGAAGFLRERARRLLLPLLLYMLLIGPLTQYFIAGSWHSRPPHSFLWEWWHHIADGEVFSESGPLWFCLVLMAFSLVFSALHRPVPSIAERNIPPLPRLSTVLLYAWAMASLAFIEGLINPHGGTVLNVELHDFPQYPLMFLAGVMAHRGHWPQRISSRAGRAWLIGGLLASIAIWAVAITQGGALHGNLRAYSGGWHWQAAAMDLWRAITCLCVSLGLITLYRDRFNRQGPVTSFLARNAFGVYVFHPPILIAITWALVVLPAGVALKFLVAAALAVAATFLFVGLVAKRTPGLRAIL
jgi:peptidoglycan/LPS O-acetylase OafA/YrhL